MIRGDFWQNWLLFCGVNAVALECLLEVKILNKNCLNVGKWHLAWVFKWSTVMDSVNLDTKRMLGNFISCPMMKTTFDAALYIFMPHRSCRWGMLPTDGSIHSKWIRNSCLDIRDLPKRLSLTEFYDEIRHENPHYQPAVSQIVTDLVKVWSKLVWISERQKHLSISPDAI